MTGIVDVIDGRTARVGAVPVRRALPTLGRRTVGAWCFADHMGPVPLATDGSTDVPPHPHTGLQTVTWLVAGEVLHRDSLGSEQVIRAGQCNLMTAGLGVAHSEEATGRTAGDLHGIQLWVAQPEATRHGPPAFEHHAELPRAALAGGRATVFVGEFAGATSPAGRDTDHFGAELEIDSGTCVLPLRTDHEHGLVVLEGAVRVAGRPLAAGALAACAPGRDELAVDADEPARVVLLGGVPFTEPVKMWWNFVARTDAELDAARAAWQADDGRFGVVASALPRVRAPQR